MDTFVVADLLDSLTSWFERQEADFWPHVGDERAETAEDKAQVEALRALRATGSLDAAFAAGKVAFDRQVQAVSTETSPELGSYETWIESVGAVARPA